MKRVLVWVVVALLAPLVLTPLAAHFRRVWRSSVPVLRDPSLPACEALDAARETVEVLMTLATLAGLLALYAKWMLPG